MSSKPKSKLTRARHLFCWLMAALGLYALIAYLIPPSDDTLIPVLGENGKWGYINASGREMIEFEWDSAALFDRENLATVSKKELFGKIDRNGDLIIPRDWGYIYEFDEHGMARTAKSGSLSFRPNLWINTEGELLFSVDGWAGDFDSEGMAIVGNVDDADWGWIDRQGREVIERRWESAGDFNEKGLAPVKKNNLWGWIDRQGEIVIEPSVESDLAPYFDCEGMAKIGRAGKFGWIDEDFKEVIPLVWEHTGEEFDSEGYLEVGRNGKLGWINRKGEEVIPVQWDHVGRFNTDGVAAARDGDGLHLINRQGETLVEMPGLIYNFNSNNHALVFSEEDISEDNAYITPPSLKYWFGYNHLRIDGWIDSKGDFLIDLRGENWRLVDQWDETNPTGIVFRGLENIIDYESAGYYVVAKPYEPGWLKSQLEKLAVWFGSTSPNASNDPRPEVRCYHKDGRLIWSSKWIRYEDKCIFMMQVSLWSIILISLVSLTMRMIREGHLPGRIKGL